MNRQDILQLETSRTRRVWVGRPEIRTSANGTGLVYEGYASTTEHAYDVYGGPPYGWNETIARGAFKKTLKENADVAFLINHEGMTLARTKSGTLRLSEDQRGLKVSADLDPGQNIVNDLRIAVDRGDVDEMSFAFRVVRDEWFDDNGEPSDEMRGTERRILETNLNRGDVSAVNYGANPDTSGGFRAVDVALAELRAGRPLNPTQRTLVRELANTLDEEVPMEIRDDKALVDALDVLELAVAAVRAQIEQDVSDDGLAPDGTPLMASEQNTAPAALNPESVAAMRSQWDLRRTA